jgi:hypothetical protein
MLGKRGLTRKFHIGDSGHSAETRLDAADMLLFLQDVAKSFSGGDSIPHTPAVELGMDLSGTRERKNFVIY